MLFLATICGGYNFLTEVNLVLSIFVALGIFLGIVLKNKLNLYVLSGYGILVFGTAFTFLVRGADDFWYRFGYNFGLSLLAIVGVTLLACIPKLKNHKVTFYVTRVTSFVLIGASLIYFLFSNIRLKPTCISLQEGHDDYLNKVKNAKSDAGDPNVLLILMDDMAFSDISSYSYLSETGKNPTIKTPNIDSIGASANNGIMMDNCYAASPVSSPSRFSILTGRYSCRGYLDNVVFNTKQQNFPFSQTRFFNPFQLAHNVDGLLGDEVTIAEILQADGYATGLFGKWNLGDYGEYLPTNQGFDYFFGSHYINDMTPYNIVEEENGEFKEIYSHNDLLDQSMSTDRFTYGDESKGVKYGVTSYIAEKADAGEKFFVEYASPWPHFPIYSNNNGNGEGDHTDDNYVDCIEEFDRAIGDIIQVLKDKGVYDNTLIMFTSDNGPGREGVTGNLRGRKNTPYEGAYKVPFLAKLPNSVTARTPEINSATGKPINIQARCMNMDVLPTVLEFCGIDINPLKEDRAIDGVSMKALWTGAIDQDTNMHDRIYYFKGGSVQAISGEFEAYNYVIADHDIIGPDGNVAVRAGESVLVVDGYGNPKTKKQDFKFYKHTQTENAAFFNQFYNNYLFNLDADPAEGYNIAMRADISIVPMTSVEMSEKKPLNYIARTLKADLEEINKLIKNDKYRRTHVFE